MEANGLKIDPDPMQQLKRIAAQIFARHGVDFAGAQRAGGWTNANWIAGGLVLRLATRREDTAAGETRLEREARLAHLLPPGAGYPTLLESGSVDGLGYMLARQVPGQCLGEAWGGLDWDQRALALRQLWARAEAAHGVDPAAAAGLARTRAWFNSNDPVEAAAALARLEGRGLFSAQQAARLRQALEQFWQALPGARLALNHGDMTLDNAIWNAGQVVSLLDFEYALLAPVELDLNHLLKIAFAAGETLELPDEKGGSGLRALQQSARELAAPLLARPGGRQRLRGYAILLDVWILEDWLAHPDGEGPLEGWPPYRNLRSLADGRGGYLSAL